MQPYRQEDSGTCRTSYAQVRPLRSLIRAPAKGRCCRLCGRWIICYVERQLLPCRRTAPATRSRDSTPASSLKVQLEGAESLRYIRAQRMKSTNATGGLNETPHTCRADRHCRHACFCLQVRAGRIATTRAPPVHESVWSARALACPHAHWWRPHWRDGPLR